MPVQLLCYDGRVKDAPMNCTKAIIPIAGYGTRRLPITKVVEKAMLPILNRPVIDYVVEDCIKAGITDIYFVVSQGSTQIRDYYKHAPALEAYLKASGKDEMISQITPPKDVRFTFVEQPTGAGAKHGTTIPVWLCREYIKPDEHILVLMGDDFIYNSDGSSEVARLIKEVELTGSGSCMLGVEVPHETVGKYGVIAMHNDGDHYVFDHIQEKPSIDEAQSNFINISKFIFEASFFEYLDKAVQKEESGEYLITDPLNAYVQDGNRLGVLPISGKYLDSGTVENWLEANNFVARDKGLSA